MDSPRSANRFLPTSDPRRVAYDAATAAQVKTVPSASASPQFEVPLDDLMDVNPGLAGKMAAVILRGDKFLASDVEQAQIRQHVPADLYRFWIDPAIGTYVVEND